MSDSERTSALGGAGGGSARRTRRRRLLVAIPLLALITLFAWGAYKVEQFQTDADQLAATGTAAIKVFKELGSGLKAGDLDHILACYASDYQSSQGPWKETLRSERDGVRVYEWGTDPFPDGPGAETSRANLRQNLATLLESIDHLDLAKLKLARVEEIHDTRSVVRSVFWLRGTRSDGETFESQAKLRFHLRREGEGWAITRQELLSGETVTGRRHGFTDIATAAGIDHRSKRNPLFSTPEWEPETFGILKFGPAGVSAADFDGDGWVDLFFGDGIHPRLYRNLGGEPMVASPASASEKGSIEAGPGMRFADITAEVGLATELPGVNVALFADLDNDGDDDLVLGRFMEGHKLYRNDGPGENGLPHFTDVSAATDLGGPFAVVASAADYDLDGDLDLYLGRYLDPRTQLPTTLFYTRNGQGNSLLRNDGPDAQGVVQFTDVTDEAGVREGGLTLGVAWADYDQDGDPDLYVANDFGRNALLRNEGPDAAGIVRFSDVSAESGALDFGFGMSASWGDADNDGDFDLYVSNVHSGQRWYGQSTTLHQYLVTSLRQGTFGEDFPLYREIYKYSGSGWRDYGDRMVKGNSLLINNGQGGFEDVSETAGANPFGWYWGSAFLDYDNDGQQDLYANNGWISGRTYDDL